MFLMSSHIKKQLDYMKIFFVYLVFFFNFCYLIFSTPISFSLCFAISPSLLSFSFFFLLMFFLKPLEVYQGIQHIPLYVYI